MSEFYVTDKHGNSAAISGAYNFSLDKTSGYAHFYDELGNLVAIFDRPQEVVRQGAFISHDDQECASLSLTDWAEKVESRLDRLENRSNSRGADLPG
jgi:hypothetical protein